MADAVARMADLSDQFKNPKPVTLPPPPSIVPKGEFTRTSRGTVLINGQEIDMRGSIGAGELTTNPLPHHQLGSPLEMRSRFFGYDPTTGRFGRAAGGVVGGGQAYIVGERGPEVFRPSGAGGMVTPGGRAGESMDTLHFDRSVGKVARELDMVSLALMRFGLVLQEVTSQLRMGVGGGGGGGSGGGGGGGGGAGYTGGGPTASGGNMQPFTGDVNWNAVAQSISAIESGSPEGNYGALGPVTKTGDRALGRYQVMGNNVGPWTEKYFGQRLTPEQFLANPAAQDAVFKGEFGSYIQKYGMENAAQAWFGGAGSIGKTSGTDQLGTSVGGYGKKFMAGYSKYGGSGTPGAGGAPSDLMRQSNQAANPMDVLGPGAQPMGVPGPAPGASTPGAAAAVDNAASMMGWSENGPERAALKKYMGGWDPQGSDNAWCAQFVNAALGTQGIAGSGSGLATSFGAWGQAATGGIQKGDVLVKHRGKAIGEKGGHVGLATGNTRTVNGRLQYEMVSGNTNDAVGTSWADAAEVWARRAGEGMSGDVSGGMGDVGGSASFGPGGVSGTASFGGMSASGSFGPGGFSGGIDFGGGPLGMLLGMLGGGGTADPMAMLGMFGGMLGGRAGGMMSGMAGLLSGGMRDPMSMIGGVSGMLGVRDPLEALGNLAQPLQLGRGAVDINVNLDRALKLGRSKLSGGDLFDVSFNVDNTGAPFSRPGDPSFAGLKGAGLF